MNHIFEHVQGHITGVFRPKLVPSAPLGSSSGGPAGNGGLLLEDGTSYLLLESGEYLLME